MIQSTVDFNDSSVRIFHLPLNPLPSLLDKSKPNWILMEFHECGGFYAAFRRKSSTDWCDLCVCKQSPRRRLQFVNLLRKRCQSFRVREETSIFADLSSKASAKFSGVSLAVFVIQSSAWTARSKVMTHLAWSIDRFKLQYEISKPKSKVRRRHFTQSREQRASSAARTPNKIFIFSWISISRLSGTFATIEISLLLVFKQARGLI